MSSERLKPCWIGKAVILAIHADQIRQHGGDMGLRDDGLLESALAKAPNRWHYETGSDLMDFAASYGYGLTCNHAFIDGNKRIAFLAMFVFLGLNGYRLIATEPEVVKLMLDVASGKCDENELAKWLRCHCHPVSTIVSRL